MQLRLVLRSSSERAVLHGQPIHVRDDLGAVSDNHRSGREEAMR
jgi:hypothetical protein